MKEISQFIFGFGCTWTVVGAICYFSDIDEGINWKFILQVGVVAFVIGALL